MSSFNPSEFCMYVGKGIVGEVALCVQAFLNGFRSGWLYTPFIDYFSFKTWPFIRTHIFRRKAVCCDPPAPSSSE